MPEFPPKAEFRKWLRSLSPNEVVAEQWTCWSCPVAAWLKKTDRADCPEIHPGMWRPDLHAVTVDLPKWGVGFVKRIDDLGRANRKPGTNPFGPVTAADCLAVLRRTPKE